MSDFLNVFRFELTNLVKKKSFVLTIVIMTFIVFGLALSPMLFNSNPDVVEEPVVTNVFKETGFILNDLSNEERSVIENSFNLQPDQIYTSRDELVKDLEDEELTVGFVINSLTSFETIYLNRSMDVDYDSMMRGFLKEVYRNNEYAQMGIDGDQINQIEQTVIENEMTILGRDSVSNYFITYVTSFAVYMILVLYGSMTATTVAREKDDRTMELLITSTKPRQLILGKVFAVLIATLIQVTTVVLGGVVGFMIAKDNYPEIIMTLFETSLTWDVILILVFYYLAGYLLYMFIFAAVGSMVSRVEDVQNATMPVLMIVMIAMFISLFSFTGSFDGLWRFASIFPLTSFMNMPARYLMTVVSPVELYTSMGLLVLSLVLLAYLSIRIYHWGSLYYGNKISFIKVIKNVFSHK